MTTAKQHHTIIGIIILLSAITIATADANIIIKAINRNVTVDAKNTRYDVTMDENNHSWDNQPTPLFEIKLNDPEDSIKDLDNCVTGTVFKYEIKNEDKRYIFYAMQSFDYETQRHVYEFEIKSTTYSVSVKFTIINIDDENPTLTPPQCRFEEKRLYNKGDSPCKCVLQDPDGWLAKTTFTLEKDKEDQESYNISDLFGMEFREVPSDTVYRADVYVTLKQKLDYDDKIYYLFNIRAEDSAHNPTTPEPLVGGFVNVQNVRSRPPIWRNGISFYTLQEKSIEHITVKALDGDTGINAKVHYDITYQDHKEEKYISIEASTGVITINQIDRDKYDLSTFNFIVKAYVIDAKVLGPWETPLNITLFVTDIDDNPPLFKRMVNRTDPNKEIIFDDDDDSPKVLDISFLENYNQSFYIDLFLQDIDTGENAQFNVKLVNTNESFDFTAAFMVMPNEGYRTGIFDIAVQDKKYLDYEDADWRYLEFEVQTTGTVNKTKSDILQVHVTLIDYNDEYPIFENTSYMTHINETAKKGTNIIQVMATDRDAEDYVLNHELVGSVNVLELIDIDNETGMIFVKKYDAFDYDTLNPIFVQVKATDKVGHEATVPVDII